MPVTNDDLHWYRAAGGDSEGGAAGVLEVVDNTDNNLFPDVGEVAALAGGADHRKVFVRNEDGVDAYLPHSIWKLSDSSVGTGYLALGFDDAEDDDATLSSLVDVAAPGKVALQSNGTDTRTATVCGVDDAGDPLWEAVVLDGTNEVLTDADFATVYAVRVDTPSGSRTVTILDGSGGTPMGTITPGTITCFRYLAAGTKSVGLLLPALPTGQHHGVYLRREWPAGSPAFPGDGMDIKTQVL